MRYYKTLLQGYLKISIQSQEPERFFRLCKNYGFHLWEIKNHNDKYICFIRIKDFKQIRKICKKTHTRVHILKKKGIPFLWLRSRKRKVFLSGIIIFAGILGILSCFIWNIHVEGNYSYSTPVIISFLEKESVKHGISKNKINCTEIAAKIRQEFPQITWVAVKIKGTRLIVQIEENMNANEDEKNDMTDNHQDLIADKNGTIVSIITRKGTPLMKAGDICKKGDLIVSGEIKIMNDANEIIDYHHVHADADVYIKTNYYYYHEFPLTDIDRIYTGKEKTRYYIQINPLRIIFGSAKEPYSFYDCISAEKQVQLTENFYLPVYYGHSISMEYKESLHTLSQKEVMKIAESELSYFLEKLKEKGVQICSNHVKINSTDTCCIVKGRLDVIEKVGVWQAVEAKKERILKTQ